VNQPWSKIVARYEEDFVGESASIPAMLVLSRRIANSHLATGLYGWTSMFDLCITQTEVVHPYYGPYLKVSPLLSGVVEFKYIDTYDERKQWHRAVEPKDVVPRLLKFLEQLRWFPAESLRP
jgi:hypothetical protein